MDLGDVTSQEGVIHRDGSVNGASDRLDYFRFTLTAARTVELALRRQDANGDLYLEDGDGNGLSSSENGGDANESIAESLGAGTYYEGASPAVGNNLPAAVRDQRRRTSGSPAITGTAQVHETLSADTSGIADANGLSNVEYAYQWVRSTGGVDTDIADATGATYTLVRGDLGHTIKVTVAFTDDDGYAETLTSGLTQTVMTEPEPKPGERTGRAVPRNAVMLVSNTGQTTSTTSYLVGVSLTYKFSSAIRFTTGSATNSYTITEASIKLTDINATAVPKLSIYTSASSVPGTLVFTFTNPGSLVTGLNTFTAPANSMLAGSTDYFVVIENTATGANYSISATASTTDDAGAATGWSLGDSRLSRSADGGAWTDEGTNPIPQVAIKGSEQPRVAPTDSPQNLRATGVAYASLNLEWDEPDTGITHIRFVRTGGNLPTDTLVAASAGSRDSRAFTLLEPDTGYTFTVEFGASATEFGPAATINVRTLPIPAPTNVRVFSQSTAADAALGSYSNGTTRPRPSSWKARSPSTTRPCRLKRTLLTTPISMKESALPGNRKQPTTLPPGTARKMQMAPTTRAPRHTWSSPPPGCRRSASPTLRSRKAARSPSR